MKNGTWSTSKYINEALLDMGALHQWSLEPIKVFIALTDDQMDVKKHLLSAKILPLKRGKILELTYDFMPARDFVENFNFYLSRHPEVEDYLVSK